jgi:hypothetical protein
MAASAMVIGGAGSVSANIAWCMADPPAQTVTQDGANLSVNTFVSVTRSEVHYLNDVHSDASSAPDGKGGTLITVHVSLPAGISTARVTATVNRYNATATAAGAGGTVVTLYLDVPKS